MITLLSLDQALSQIGLSCASCDSLNWKGVYGSTRRGENGTLIYQCNLGIGRHDQEAQLSFEDFPEEAERTLKALLSLITRSMKDSIPLTRRRLETGVKLLPPDFSLEMEGYCPRCLDPTTFSIQNRELEYGCRCHTSYVDDYESIQID